jgi:hypothetical protein
MFKDEISFVNESIAEDCKKIQSQYQQLQKTLEKCNVLSEKLMSNCKNINTSNLIKRVAASRASSQDESPLNFGSFSKILGLMSGFFNNARATGGNVSQSVPYLVGERGPEIFVPGSSGRIIPNNRSGESRAVNIVMNINTPDAATFRKSHNQIVSELARAVRGAKNI